MGCPLKCQKPRIQNLYLSSEPYTQRGPHACLVALVGVPIATPWTDYSTLWFISSMEYALDGMPWGFLFTNIYPMAYAVVYANGVHRGASRVARDASQLVARRVCWVYHGVPSGSV